MATSNTDSTLQPDHTDRMARARLSLEGLSVGDALGERFFYKSDVESLISRHALPRAPWRYTDDMMMALSIVEVLDRHGRIEHDVLAQRFAERYEADAGRGYGPTAMEILEEIGRGMPWGVASRHAFNGEGSMGNGGAMRAGPVGAYFADDFQAVVENACASAIVTHAHPEGQAGAVTVAIAAAQAWRLRSEDASSGARTILEAAIEYTPKGMTRKGLKTALMIPTTEEVEAAVAVLGNGSRIISHDTVPFALWCAARHLTDFEGAFWATASALGDIDTNCAIVGSIVAMSLGREGVPVAWIEAREPLDK